MPTIPSIQVTQGDYPVLISIPHDGHLSGSIEYSHKRRDLRTKAIGKQVGHRIFAKLKKSPLVVFEPLHRRFLSAGRQDQYAQRIASLSDLANIQLIIDLHGFSHRPPHQPYDVILGTHHTKNLMGTSYDYLLSSYLSSLGYKAYLPSAQPQANERFTAECSTTMVNRIIRKMTKPIPIIQLEIERDLRVSDQGRLQLASDIGDFLGGLF